MTSADHLRAAERLLMEAERACSTGQLRDEPTLISAAGVLTAIAGEHRKLAELYRDRLTSATRKT